MMTTYLGGGARRNNTHWGCCGERIMRILKTEIRRLRFWATIAGLFVLIAVMAPALSGIRGGTVASPVERVGPDAGSDETFRVDLNAPPRWKEPPLPKSANDGPPPAARPSARAEQPTTPASNGAAPRGVERPESGTTPAREVVNLWHVDGAGFESNLLESMGGGLISRPLSSDVVEFSVPTHRPEKPRLRLDRSRGQVVVEGPEQAVQGVLQLVHALDTPVAAGDPGVRYVPTSHSPSLDEAMDGLMQAVRMDASRSEYRPAARESMTVAMQATPGAPAEEEEMAPDRREQPSPGLDETSPEAGRLVAPVQVQVLEGLDALIIRGRPEDVKRIQELIRQIEEYSKITKPAVEVIMLKHVDATALAVLLRQLYQEVYAPREGTMSITPLAVPNGLLLVGRPETVEKLRVLIEQLDQPVSPTARFQIFFLKNVSAEDAQTAVTSFFEETDTTSGMALVPRVQAVADFRSNSLIVRANPRDMAEVSAMLARLDTGESKSFNEVRVFKLKNANATDLATVLQDALTGQMYGQRARTGGMGMAGAMATDYEKKSTRLKMVTIDGQGHTVLSSGILTDAQVTADTRINALVVTASPDSMELIAALVAELDRSPTIESQVKVFTLVNGDATNMAAMLESIFGAAVAGQEIAVRTGVVEDETSLVGLRFAVDVRTNSVIVTGSAGALTVVEAVLARLDGSDPRQRRNTVYRVKNINATNVATAVNQYLSTKREIETLTTGVISAFEQIEREVIVVAEESSNSLIVSATPRYYDEIVELIEQLDRRPSMAVIQVVIAEVGLDNFDEFGIELGLQDSVLFNRTLGTSIANTLNIPGTLVSNGAVAAGQAMTTLGTARSNSALGYSGLVLSASSESVSALIRALSTCRKFKVLSRPQIMALDNELAQIVVGEDVPYITGTSFSEFGQQNSVDYREVGLILQVTPRVTPDGLIVMQIIATNSKVGAEADGIPVSVADGQVIRSPRIEMISAETAISAADGQTVVLGGLIVDDNETMVRRVPVVSTIPVVGNLFKYESTIKSRKELLIILTPRIVGDARDAERIACVESSRMHWCRADLQRMHAGYGSDPFFAEQGRTGPRVIYPHETPTIDMMPDQLPGPRGAELVPTPEGAPGVPLMRNPTQTPVETGADRRVAAGRSPNASPVQATPWRPGVEPAASGSAPRYAVHPLPPVVGAAATAATYPPGTGPTSENPASPNRNTYPGTLVQYRDDDRNAPSQPVQPATYLERR
ncbi:MAG TPA: hypothetical protein DD670_05390 [Planctomycetaceae bacterium]|nr:hypothetical protein [Planctomycetaceae bacterium]